MSSSIGAASSNEIFLPDLRQEGEHCWDQGSLRNMQREWFGEAEGDFSSQLLPGHQLVGGRAVFEGRVRKSILAAGSHYSVGGGKKHQLPQL